MRSRGDDTTWAVHAFAEAERGDLRRTTRLIALAAVLAQHPRASRPEARGHSAMLTAAYRFLANEASEPHDIIHSHIEATYGRLDAVPVVWAVQDTTEVNWTSRRATTGLGPLGHTACQGRLVPSTLAIPPARVPLGLLAQQVGARDANAVGTRTRRQPLPIPQKARQQWLGSLEAVYHAHAGCPQTRFGSVGDRAADLSDVRAAARPAGVALLLRAAWKRCVSAPQHSIWATVAAQPVVRTLGLASPRRGTPPARAARRALRSWALTWCPPRHRKAEGWPAVPLWAGQVHESEPPPEVEPIEWRLLTTVAVETIADALERVQWYAGRWGLEVGQRILQCGCGIAARQRATAERLRRCLALYSVLAWRLLYATMLARSVPEAPCSVLVAPEAWPALYCAIPRVSQPPPEPPSLAQVVPWMAQLGGLVGRRRRDHPGPAVLWRGVQPLSDLTTMYCMMRPSPSQMNKCG